MREIESDFDVLNRLNKQAKTIHALEIYSRVMKTTKLLPIKRTFL